jgi:hypothetical protein
MRSLANGVSVDRGPCRSCLTSTIGVRAVAMLAALALIGWTGAVPAVCGESSRDTTYTLYTLEGEAAGANFGLSVSGAEDVDNDGCDDVIIGAPGNYVSGSDSGHVYVYSGRTGDLLWRFSGEVPGHAFGYSVCGAGDVDSDGYADLIVGAPFGYAGDSVGGRAYVYSGQNGNLLWTFSVEEQHGLLGHSVSGAGDTDDDGYDDLVVGAPYISILAAYAGEVYVYSGRTGDLMTSLPGQTPYAEFGSSVSGAGDVDGDGHDDLIVGAYNSNVGGPGRADVFSGRTGGRLFTFTGEAGFDFFGWSVSGVGDANDDGYADLIVGAYGNDAGGERAGRAYVYSGCTALLLEVFTGEAARDYLGWSVSGAGDVNNDGYADLIAGAPGNDGGGVDAGRAYVYSGRSGNVLGMFTGEAAGDQFGLSVSGAGDVNNDGYAEFIVGAPYNDAAGDAAGRAYVYVCQVEDPFVRGDADQNGVVDLDDLVYVLNYLFKEGPPPVPPDAGDTNCDGIVDIRDAVKLLNYLLRGGPPPGC